VCPPVRAATDPRGDYALTINCTAGCSGQHGLALTIAAYDASTGAITGYGHTLAPDPQQSFTGTGTYTDTSVSFQATYGSSGQGYQLSGSVSNDGSLSGSGSDSNGDTFTFGATRQSGPPPPVGDQPGLTGDSQSGPDGDHDGIPDDLERLLAQKFAPTLLFHPDERNYPVTPDWLLSRTKLQFTQQCGLSDFTAATADEHPTEQSLLSKVATAGPCGSALLPFTQLWSAQQDPDSPAFSHDQNKDCYILAAHSARIAHETFDLSTVGGGDQHGSLDPSEWTTYYHVYPAYDGGAVVQYWHLFAYNDYKTRAGSAVGHCDQHGGDWDASIQVRLDSRLQPVAVYFSRHTEDDPGTPVAWSAISRDGSTDHPLVMADAGGHGAYAGPSDFCGYRADPSLPNLGEGSWAYGASAAAGDLREIDCKGRSPKPPTNDRRTGGTVWRTWDTSSSSVSQSRVDVRLQHTGSGGPLSNLGEYNPGGMTPCPTADGGFGQRCIGLNPWSAGSQSYYPLEGNDFIGYSGLWGDPNDQASGFGIPPRGPVFQGRNPQGQYSSWYNLASADAAAKSWVAWLTPGAPDSPFVRGARRALARQRTLSLSRDGRSLLLFRLANTGLTTARARVEVRGSSATGARASRGPRTVASVTLSLPAGVTREIRARLKRSAARHAVRRGAALVVRVTLRTATHPHPISFERRIRVR
jgi:hypothetical protein